MRRNVQEAIRRVRAEVTAAKRYQSQVGYALELAEMLADEVERLHKRLQEAERISSPVARDAWHDEQVLMHVATHSRRSISMVDLENAPPDGLTSTQARVTAQRLVSRGELYVDKNLRLRCGKG